MIPLDYNQMNGKRTINSWFLLFISLKMPCDTAQFKPDKESVGCSAVICVCSQITCRLAQFWPSVSLAVLQSRCVEVLILGL